MRAILLILLFSLPALADDNRKLMATCVGSGGTFDNDLKIQFFDGIGPDQQARVTSYVEGQGVIMVPAALRLFSWVEYEGRTEAFGNKYRMIFSNYQTPSLGKLYINDQEAVPVACAIY